MRPRLRLVAAAVGFLLPALLLARWQTVVGMRDAALAAPELPDAIGPWRLAEEARLSDDHFAMLMPDAHVWRRYEAAGRAPIWVYIALYAGRAGYDGGAHDPEVCYPAQGWEIMDSRALGIPLAGAATLRARLLAAHQESLEQSVVYWFQPAGRWPADAAAEQLVRIFDAVTGRPQYAFVRLSAPGGNGASAERDLAEFAAQIAWPVRGWLEGKPRASATTRSER